MTAPMLGRDSAERYGRFFELSPDLLCLITAEGTFLDVNPAWQHSLGWTREELLGRSYLGLVHPEDEVSTRKAATRLAQGETIVGFENRYRHRDGTWRWLDWSAAPAPDEDLIHAVVRDVTRHRRERAWAEEHEAVSGVGTWEVDLDTHEVIWSPETYRIHGLEPGPEVATTVEQGLSRYTPEGAAVIAAAFHRLVADGTPYDLTVGFETAHRWVRTTGRAAWREGRIVRVYGSIQDVTERQRQQLRLEEANARLARALEAGRDGWWEVELPDGPARYAPRWWELHGYRQDELPVSASLWQAMLLPQERARVESRLTAAFAAGQRLVEMRALARSKEGVAFPIEIRALVEYRADGTPWRISGTTRDLTELVRSERMQEQFLATVSHEVRTPLTSIGAAIDLLRTGRCGPVDEVAAELLEVADRNVGRLHRLIADLLDVERLSSGQPTVVLRPTPIAPMLRDAVADRLRTGEVGDIRVELTSSVPDDLVVALDAERIHQVLTNYLSNALRYAPSGTTVEVVAEVEVGRVRVGVRDAGPGVPDGFEARAFTRFAQADPSDPRSRGGTGLGLAIARELVERHGGSVGYASSPGATEFWFTLPLPD